MEATFLAKRAVLNIPKFLPQDPPGIQCARRFTRACLSTASQLAEGNNAVAEADAPRDAMYEAKQQTFATGEGTSPSSSTSFAEDTAKDRIKMAVEMAENVGGTARKTLNGAWKTARYTAHGIKKE